MKRIAWIDITKYVCIIFVIIEHLESKTAALQKFYMPFFLMAFFFVSGYCYHEEASFSIFLKKKIRQLLLPWLYFSLFSVFSSQLLTFGSHSGLAKELAYAFLQIRERQDKMWFVAALFVAYIPFYFLISNRKLTRRKKLAISVCLSFASMIYCRVMNPDLLPWGSYALPWHLEYIFQAMLFMVLGFFFKEQYEGEFDKHNTKLNRTIVLLLYLAVVYFVPADFQDTIIITYLKQILGVAAVISVCKVVKTNRYISFVGANTLIYLGLHGKVLSLGQAVFRRFFAPLYSLILDNPFCSSLFAVCYALVISAVLIIPAIIINRWFPFLVGRKKRVKQ